MKSAAAAGEMYAGSGLGVYRGRKGNDTDFVVPALLVTLGALPGRGDAMLYVYSAQEIVVRRVQPAFAPMEGGQARENGNAVKMQKALGRLGFGLECVINCAQIQVPRGRTSGLSVASQRARNYASPIIPNQKKSPSARPARRTAAKSKGQFAATRWRRG
jgi:hypothetical protein